jgi:hypothetical protein
MEPHPDHRLHVGVRVQDSHFAEVHGFWQGCSRGTNRLVDRICTAVPAALGHLAQTHATSTRLRVFRTAGVSLDPSPGVVVWPECNLSTLRESPVPAVSSAYLPWTGPALAGVGQPDSRTNG